MENKTIADSLNPLIEILKDGQEGYQLASDATQTPEIRQLLADLSTERAAFANELQMIVHRLGEEFETEASTAGGVHRTWINLKSALTSGDDYAILTECERGDSVAMEKFQAALAGDPLPDDIRPTVARQSVAIRAAHARMYSFRT